MDGKDKIRLLASETVRNNRLEIVLDNRAIWDDALGSDGKVKGPQGYRLPTESEKKVTKSNFRARVIGFVHSYTENRVYLKTTPEEISGKDGKLVHPRIDYVDGDAIREAYHTTVRGQNILRAGRII